MTRAALDLVIIFNTAALTASQTLYGAHVFKRISESLPASQRPSHLYSYYCLR